MISMLAALEALDAAVEALGAIDPGTLAAPERFAVLERLETSRRRQIAVAHDIVARLEQFEGCPPVWIALADVLRISRAEARRRMRDAEQLAPRTTLTGQQLPSQLPATTKAWQAGVLDIEHLRVIQKFFRELPEQVAPIEVEKAERALAEHAENLRPDQLEKFADRLALTLNPDGRFSDQDRARKRGFVWCGGQRADGMSVGKLIANPQLRAEFDAWFAKFAAPGMCNPADQTAVIDGRPAQAQADADLRSHSQRQHDALSALVRGQLGDPKLGTHNGLPVTVIVSATVQDLQAQSGHAVTGGGTLLPMADVIRMASHSYHYLALFDGVTGQALWLGRTKRLATADQRIVLHTKDRGCTAPGCTVPGYGSQVHHATKDWSDGGNTNIDDLTFACKCHNLLIENSGWTTRKRKDGNTEWIPPPQLPLIPGGTNTYHHPEVFLQDDL